MINSSSLLENLIEELKTLPGVGKKSATRLAYHLANTDKEKLISLSSAIKNISEVKRCKKCFSFSDTDICEICRSEKRDKKQIMVVENERDMYAYESIGEYKGLYHILGGALSPLEDIGPNELKIKELMSRLIDVEEVIIATNSSIEGETTASYLIKLIKPLGIRVSRIASGVPVGGDIENIDSVTLYRALSGRQIV